MVSSGGAIVESATSLTSLQSTALANGNIWIGSAGGVAAAAAPSGDVSMTNAGAFTVTGLHGKTVSATAPTTSGQVLRYDGTSTYIPALLGLADIRANIIPFGGVFASAGCTASQSLYWQSSSDTFQCQSVALADSQITYASKSANTFLAAPNGSAGAPTFRAIASADLPATGATGAYINGGNSFGQAATLGTNDLNTVGIKTNNLTRMTFDTSGNVGIGTTVPGSNFDVSGTIRTDTICDRTGANCKTINTGWTSTGAATSMIANWPDTIRCAWDAATDTVILYSYALAANGSIQYMSPYGAMYVLNFNADGTYSSNAGLYNGTAYNCVGKSISQLNTSGQTWLLAGGGGNIWTLNSSNAYYSGGNVGIGTTAPSRVLHIVASSPGAMMIESSSSAVNSVIELKDSTAAQNLVGGINFLDTAGAARAQIAYGSVNNATMPEAMLFTTAGTERLRITSAGNVGIGTTSPAYKLQVANGVNTANNILASFGTTEANWQGLYFQNFTTMGTGIQAAQQSIVNNNLFLNPYGGNVGIGTTNPTATLDVYSSVNGIVGHTTAAGVAAVTGISSSNASNGFAGFFQNTGSATYCYISNTAAVNCSSDARLKSNVQTYPVLDRLDHYRAVSFDWKKGGVHDVGVIAQELYKSFPEMVTKGSDTADLPPADSKSYISATWNVKYDRLGALALQAVKELYGEFKSIVARVTTLEDKESAKDRTIASVKIENAQLKARVDKADKENAEIKAYLCGKDRSAIFCK